MPDRKKYIEVLSKAAKVVKEFNEDTPIILGLKFVEDILELLKEQEPKLVVNIHKHYNNATNPNVPWVGRCPKCDKLIEGRNLTRFCKYCGQAVKWND